MLVFGVDGAKGTTHVDAALLALFFAIVIICLNGAFGLYRRTQVLSTSGYFLRVFLAPVIGIPLAFLGAQLLPGAATFQDQWAVAILLSLIGLLFIRHVVVLPLVTRLLPHRVLVLGTGPEARLVEASLASANPLGMRLIGFYGLETGGDSVVSPGQVIARSG